MYQYIYWYINLNINKKKIIKKFPLNFNQEIQKKFSFSDRDLQKMVEKINIITQFKLINLNNIDNYSCNNIEISKIQASIQN